MLMVENAQPTILDADLATTLVELTKADDVTTEPRYIIHLSEQPVLLVFALEHHDAFAANHRHRAISKFHCSLYCLVEQREQRLVAGHVITGAHVEVPHTVAGILFATFFSL